VSEWRIEETSNGLRLAPIIRRKLGAEDLTWADLLHSRISSVQVYVLYFPSRFDLDVDAAAKSALESFGRLTGLSTSVSFWDPTDPEFSQALAFFDMKAPPALVLVRGLKANGRRTLARADLYAIAITDPQTLCNRERLAAAVNSAHEVLVGGDPKEIAGYVRERAAVSLLAALGRIGGALRDQIVKCKPEFQLPGGIAISLG
jgi:hypothetical protein